MAVKINWHRYGTKLRHCHPTYTLLTQGQFYAKVFGAGPAFPLPLPFPSLFTFPLPLEVGLLKYSYGVWGSAGRLETVLHRPED